MAVVLGSPHTAAKLAIGYCVLCFSYLSLNRVDIFVTTSTKSLLRLAPNSTSGRNGYKTSQALEPPTPIPGVVLIGLTCSVDPHRLEKSNMRRKAKSSYSSIDIITDAKLTSIKSVFIIQEVTTESQQLGVKQRLLTVNKKYYQIDL